MKEVLYNDDSLCNDDITEVVVRVKALIINNNNMILGSENSIYQFPGGHLEENETLIECLKREILEETGMDIVDEEINGPFMKVIYMNKDWPDVGTNRRAEIYYYVVETSKIPDLSKANYTEHERKNNFKVELIPVNSAIDIIKKNIPNNEMNTVIAPDMILAIKEYLSLKNNV